MDRDSCLQAPRFGGAKGAGGREGRIEKSQCFEWKDQVIARVDVILTFQITFIKQNLNLHNHVHQTILWFRVLAAISMILHYKTYDLLSTTS